MNKEEIDNILNIMIYQKYITKYDFEEHKTEYYKKKPDISYYYHIFINSEELIVNLKHFTINEVFVPLNFESQIHDNFNSLYKKITIDKHYLRKQK